MRSSAIVLVLLAMNRGQAVPLPDSSLGLNEIQWQPEKTLIFLGSPSLLRMKNGDILASADRFGTGCRKPYNVSVYRSTDDGESWEFVQWVKQQYWSNLFQVDAKSDDVYLLGTWSNGPSPMAISHSADGGKSWSDSVILFGHVKANDSYETGPTPSLLHNGKVYRAMERMRPPFQWGADYEAVVIYADVQSNLTDPASWTISEPLPFNKSWIPASWDPAPDNPGYLEGNMVAGPDGTLYNILRFNSRPYIGNYAVMLRFNEGRNAFEFDSIIKLPGGHTKFMIRRDPATGLYITLSNPNTDAKYIDQRNILALCSSPDLRNWTEHAVVLQDDTGFKADDSVAYTGFHYVDWRFDNKTDLMMAVRTGYRGANSYHNSNRLTYKRLPNFRSLLKQRISLAVYGS